jgi:hypothetical protein
MICQVVLGAILTALGSMTLRDGTPITVMAAMNTIDAGLLALMHNSGLPDRFRLNRVEFSKVKDFIRVRCSSPPAVQPVWPLVLTICPWRRNC